MVEASSVVFVLVYPPTTVKASLPARATQCSVYQPHGQRLDRINLQIGSNHRYFSSTESFYAQTSAQTYKWLTNATIHVDSEFPRVLAALNRLRLGLLRPV